MLVTGPENALESACHEIAAKIEITELGKPERFLSVRIHTDDEGASLSQSTYVTDVLAACAEAGMKPVSTPMEPGSWVDCVPYKGEQQAAVTKAYQQMVR